MNWLFVVICIWFLIGLIMGICRGGVKIVASLLATIVTLVAVFYLTPYVREVITKVTPVQSVAENWIQEKLVDGLEISEEEEEKELSREEQSLVIKDMSVPKALQRILQTNNNNAIYERLGVTTFAQYISRYLAGLMTNMAAFLITFLVISIVVRAVVFSLNVVSELPVVGLVNRLVGGALGMVGVLVLVWILFVVITLMCTTSIGKDLYELIQSDSILSIIYEYNPILKLAMIIRG